MDLCLCMEHRWTLDGNPTRCYIRCIKKRKKKQSCNCFGTNTNTRNNNKIKGGIQSIYPSENTRQLQGQRLIGQVYSHVVHRHTKSIIICVDFSKSRSEMNVRCSMCSM